VPSKFGVIRCCGSGFRACCLRHCGGFVSLAYANCFQCAVAIPFGDYESSMNGKARRLVIPLLEDAYGSQ